MTLPSLSKLFSRSFIAIPMQTYGLPLDILSLLFQRNTPFPTETTRILYTQLRSSLLDTSIHRVVVLSHNLGSLPVSKALSQLFSDLPGDKLSKLEIYTFGAATSEFVLPTGEAPLSAPSSPSLTNGAGNHQQPVLERRAHRLPHVEHFALAADPFAAVGVLRASKETLETRFCGGVFVMSPHPPTTNPPTQTSSPTTTSPPQPGTVSPSPFPSSAHHPTTATGLSVGAYLTALFPTQMTASRGARASVLDGVMVIDRDVAEKREFAAMSNFAALRTSASPRDGKRERLSWTALGATAGKQQHQNRKVRDAVMDGVAGLELARRGCKDCDGHRGREVSWLVRYVNVGCVEEGGAAWKADGPRVADGGMNGIGLLNGHGVANGEQRME